MCVEPDSSQRPVGGFSDLNASVSSAAPRRCGQGLYKRKKLPNLISALDIQELLQDPAPTECRVGGGGRAGMVRRLLAMSSQNPPPPPLLGQAHRSKR